MPKKDINVKLDIANQAKTQGLNSKFQSAAAIAEPLINEKFKTNKYLNLPNPSNIVRVINRVREKDRPRNPKDIWFNIKLENIPNGFYQGEVKVGKFRHMVFANETQLKLMSTSKRWYCDGTFKLVKKPFVQMFSFHGMQKKDGNTKQFPFLYVMMSRRTAADYKQVFKKIKQLLGINNLLNIQFQTLYQYLISISIKGTYKVKEVVSDFERAIWRGIQDVFPNVKIFGCAFHWTQAIFRNMKQIGLGMLYNRSSEFKNFMRQIMSMHLLPAKKIPKIFKKLKKKATNIWNGDNNVAKFMKYIEKTWIESQVSIKL